MSDNMQSATEECTLNAEKISARLADSLQNITYINEHFYTRKRE